MSFEDEAREPIDAAPSVGILDRPRLRAVIRGLEQAEECSEQGHHTAAAVMAGHALIQLEWLVRDSRLPDYETALRERLIRDIEPILSPERDHRDGA